jgi:glycosyltransferase involved in cell wall biosynthesis
MSHSPSLSVAIIAHNEEKNLPRLLSSLKFADEIVVVENDSTDQTVELAKNHGAKVFSHHWEGYANQRNFSITHTTSDWVLIVDADEVVSEILATEIRQVITQNNRDGYLLPTRNFIGNRSLNHGGWYPDWHLRLVRRDLAVYHEKAIHENIDGITNVGHLKSPLLHYTYDSIYQWIEKANHYTTLEVAKKPFSLMRLVLKPPATFIRSYIFWSGWRDGILGFIASVMGSWYAFVSETKRWEKG